MNGNINISSKTCRCLFIDKTGDLFRTTLVVIVDCRMSHVLQVCLVPTTMFYVADVTRASKDLLAAPPCVTPTVPGTVHVSNLTCVIVTSATRDRRVHSSRASPGTSAQVRVALLQRVLRYYLL